MFFLRILATILAVLAPVQAFSVPLQTYDVFTTNNPYSSRKGQFVELLVRGTGTNDMYVLEADPTTGAIPVSGNFSLTLDNDTNYGVVGADTLRTAAQIGNATGAADFNAGNASAQTLRTVIATDQSAIPVTGSFALANDTDYGVVGTDTLRTAAQIGNATGAANFNYGAAGAQTLRTASQIGNAAGAADFNYGTIGAQSLRTAAQIGNSSGAAAFGTGTRSAQTLRVTVATDDVVPVSGTVAATQSGTWNITNVSGTVSLPTGASTEATLSTLNGKVANDYGASTGAVRTASQVGNATGVADFNTGAAGAQTLRVVTASNNPQPAGRGYADSSYMSYSSTNVTTGAWVQLIASTAATINELYIFSSCSETLELGTGSAASETRKFLIPPGGIDSVVNLTIPSGTRIALRGVSGNCSTGQITVSGLN